MGAISCRNTSAWIMLERGVALAIATLLCGLSLAAAAQAPEKKAHIGILVGGSLAQRTHLEQALLQGLREEGYVEGRNLVVERRYANGQVQRMPEFARELASMRLDAVVTTCTPTTRIAQQALGNTPIIMAAVADPVGQRLIASLAKPGANITGLSSQAEDIMPRMLELFAGVLPRPTMVAVLIQSNSEVHPRMWEALRPAARALNLELVKVDGGTVVNSQLPAAFEAAVRAKAGAVFILPDEPLFLSRRAEIVTLAAKHRLPAFYGAREFVVDGGLMSYGENLQAAYRGAAGYVSRVAQGANPGDIPVQQPTKFEFVLNPTTARALGIVIPQTLRLSADEVIE